MISTYNLALAPHLLARYVPGQGLFLLSERGAEVLVGESFGVLLPLLTGELSLDEILDRATPQCSEAEVLYALEMLRAHRCLVELRPQTQAPAPAQAVHSAGVCPSRGTISVVNHSAQDDAPLTALLRAHGVQLDAMGKRRVVLVDDYLDPVLAAHNAEALASGEPWLLIKPVGSILWFGPLFTPGQTGCWECLADRLRLNRRVLRFLEQRLGAPLRLPAVSSPVDQALASGLAASTILRWLDDGATDLLGALRTFDTTSHKSEQHVLTRRPQCPACGAPAPAPGPIALEPSAQPLASRDGGLRSRSASAVYAALQQHVSGVLGIVPHLHPLDTGDEDIHVYIAGQNLGATGGTLQLLESSLRSRCSGKGITRIQARTSAVCESIERYACVYQGHEPYLVASADELGELAIHANDCMLFSATQYAERQARNRSADAFNRIPSPLSPQQRLWWSPVWSLPEQQRKYAPTAYLYFHSEALRDPVGLQTCKPDSNGVATGSTYAEAVLQGLLELIERDAVALWWYPRTPMPQVELDSFGSEFLRHCLRYHAKLDRALWVLDLTSDLGIPAFVGVSRRQRGEQQILMGFGAHPDARLAVERAVAETNQLLAAAQPMLQHPATGAPAIRSWLREATVEREPYLLGQPGALRTAAEYAAAPVSIEAALQRCIAAVQAAGLRLYALDLTRPDIDLKVVRVLCPGLRHFWARHAPGRLYDVPLRLGRLTQRQGEADLNPIAMFL
jgi:ribosomal protein S12 methylthiotransferase accessory factor